MAASDSPETPGTDTAIDAAPGKAYRVLPMVGIGGSAGGITAMQSFFAKMPADSGMVFVVILHLSPDHVSTLAELLQASTRMQVMQAKDGQTVQANCVYVIPPGKHLAAEDGHLRLTKLGRARGRHVAVDLFFRTLADTHGERSAAIVLSGADGDGAIGIKRVKERGGLTIAQDPDQAEHNGMPRAAIETGMVDWVLQVEQMPERLLDYMARERLMKLPPEEGPQPAQPLGVSPDESEAALRDVLAFVRVRTGRDFSHYKRATILRRIARRMRVNGLDDIPGYLAYLRTHVGETGALLQDLLISVTNFFRDRDAFGALEKRIPELFKNKGPDDTVRAWVAGCATGEEAYSIAILLCEYARQLDAPPMLQVFATDLDENAIRTGRDGLYPEAITADVSEDRLRRFFIREHHGYRVRRELREIVLFALHDLLKDSPFSRLDLISCRNLLIYLNREAQTRLLSTFHFALRHEGRLFLGSSESVDDGTPLFTVLDKKHRIYAFQPADRVGLPIPMGPGMLSLLLEAHAKESPVIFPVSHAMARGEYAAGAGERGIAWSDAHYKLIERLGPPSLIVNEQYEIVHLSDTAGQFLQFSGGVPSKNLTQLIHPMLRIELRAALYRAAQSRTPAEVFEVPAEIGGARRSVNIRVMPVDDVASGFLLVLFESHAATGAPEEAAARVDADSVTGHLERELDRMKAQLRESGEQFEASTEELKASNEELQAMNEELRSATEELETSREELQSINEELTAVNAELKGKVEELAHANSDLFNLMASTAIATVFVNRDLRIMRYTPPAVALFNLIPSDLGRPLTDLKHRLDYPEMEQDALRVLSQLVPAEREVCAEGRWYLTRTLPYRTSDDRIAGVVLTFVDITGKLEMQGKLEEKGTQLSNALEEAQAATRAKDHFLAVVSHELRTPLTPVLFTAQALTRRTDLPGEVREGLTMIVENAKMEARLIDELLDLTRFAHGKIEVIKEEADLHEAIRRAVEVCGPDMEAKKQDFHMALDAARHQIRGDMGRLQQVFWNLLKNASKFTPDGGEIRLRSLNDGGRVLVEITDNGMGMEGEVLRRIFNPFEQADESIARSFGGLGLGLAIAEAIVNAHGGKILATSAGRDQGATLTVSLPLQSEGSAGFR